MRRYVKETVRARGEALDCAVYSLAALMILGPSVYERLDYWVEKMRGAGENDQGPTTEASAFTQRVRQMSRRRLNWINAWK